MSTISLAKISKTLRPLFKLKIKRLSVCRVEKSEETSLFIDINHRLLLKSDFKKEKTRRVRPLQVLVNIHNLISTKSTQHYKHG